jgi:hypothetical protein
MSKSSLLPPQSRPKTQKDLRGGLRNFAVNAVRKSEGGMAW